jgi:hypothetical protein
MHTAAARSHHTSGSDRLRQDTFAGQFTPPQAKVQNPSQRTHHSQRSTGEPLPSQPSSSATTSERRRKQPETRPENRTPTSIRLRRTVDDEEEDVGLAGGEDDDVGQDDVEYLSPEEKQVASEAGPVFELLLKKMSILHEKVERLERQGHIRQHGGAELTLSGQI